jgi:hypothetical protein
LKQQDNKLAEAMREPWDSLHEMLVGISEKLTDKDGDGQEAVSRYAYYLIRSSCVVC